MTLNRAMTRMDSVQTIDGGMKMIVLKPFLFQVIMRTHILKDQNSQH